MHLIRNALDHGIEPPAERELANKPAQGTLRLSARQRGSQMIVTIEDDGRGISPDRVREAALSAMSDRDTLELIFAPGFSTSLVVTETSGRGVGLDVVRSNVQAMGGSVRVDSRPGQGTRFELTLPLTLAITKVLIVGVGVGKFAFPAATVEQLIEVRTSDLQRQDGHFRLRLGEANVPMLRLSSLLGMTTEPNGASALPVVILGDVDRMIGLAVDSLIDEQDVVIKPLGSLLAGVSFLSGGAILANGDIALALDSGALLREAQRIIIGITAKPETSSIQPRLDRGVRGSS